MNGLHYGPKRQEIRACWLEFLFIAVLFAKEAHQERFQVTGSLVLMGKIRAGSEAKQKTGTLENDRFYWVRAGVLCAACKSCMKILILNAYF